MSMRGVMAPEGNKLYPISCQSEAQGPTALRIAPSIVLHQAEIRLSCLDLKGQGLFMNYDFFDDW